VRVIGGHSRTSPPKTLTREQIDRPFEQLDPRDRLFMLLLRWTGLRISEALGLRWEDLRDSDGRAVLLVRRQWQDGRLVERTKTSAGVRAVAVVPSLAEALLDARANATFRASGDPISPPVAAPTKTATTCAADCGRRRRRPACPG
jgi:integrase